MWGLVTKLFDDAHRGKPRAFQVREDNPARDVRGPDRGQRPAKQFLYPTELSQLLACAEVPVQCRELYAVAGYTYLRAGELRALVWDDIDLERRAIHVTKSVDRSTHVVKPTKTGHTRLVKAGRSRAGPQPVPHPGFCPGRGRCCPRPPFLSANFSGEKGIRNLANVVITW